MRKDVEEALRTALAVGEIYFGTSALALTARERILRALGEDPARWCITHGKTDDCA